MATILPTMSGSRARLGLISLAGLALVLRVWTVAILSTDHAGPVAYEHGRIAENLLAGRGFSIELLGTYGPTSQQAPVYPCLLAVAYSLFGVASPQAVLAMQLLQCVAGTLLVLAVVWVAWSLLPEKPGIGWVAGAGAALYPTHVYAVTHLQVALWAALLLTALIGVVVAPGSRARWRGALLAGLLAGLLLLTDPILAVALPIVAAAFWLADGDGSWRARFALPALGRVALMAGVAGVLIAPWTIRNWVVHREPVFIKSTFGYALWQGNNSISWGTDKIPKPSVEILRQTHDGTLRGVDRALWEARHETLYIDDVLLKPTGYREFAGLSEPQRSALLGRRAWQFIRENPGHYARLCLKRLRYFLLFDETNPKATHQLYRVATSTWLVLATLGLAVSAGQWRRLWPTYAIFLVVTAFHTLVITSVRFRIPVEPLSFVWAAAAVAPLLGRLLPERKIRIYRPGEQTRGTFGAAHALGGPHFNLPKRRRAG